MKKQALTSGVLLLVTACFALLPSLSAMALEDGTIDYGGNINQINNQTTENTLVQALDDGGYVIAGVSGDCQSHAIASFDERKMVDQDKVADGSIGEAESHTMANFYGCSCGVIEPLKLGTFGMGSDEDDLICGYVARYKADGTKVWQTDLSLFDFPSMDNPTGYNYDEEDNVTGEKYPTGIFVDPLQLKETSAGVGYMANEDDYFLFDMNTGEIKKSYAHSEVIRENDELYQNEPYWANINSDGSTTYFSSSDYAFHKKTSATEITTIAYDTDRFSDSPIATKNNLYIVECAETHRLDNTNTQNEINLYSRENCELAVYNENFQNRRVVPLETDNEFRIAGAYDDLIIVTATAEATDENGWYFTDLGNYVIKDDKIIASKELSGLKQYYDADMPQETATQFGLSIAKGIGAADLVETKDGLALATYSDGSAEVVLFDKNLNAQKTIELNMSGDDAYFNDIAFLRDGSITGAGADTASSDYYEVDGVQNGTHVHYQSVILLNGEGSENSGIANPNTLDTIELCGLSLAAVFSAACLLVKRYGRR